MLFPADLLLIRHGTTAYNAADRLQGRIDLPLSDRGRREALSLAKVLAGESIDLVICSPMIRARQTADIAMDGREVDFRIEDSFVEIDIGEWEGQEYGAVRSGDPEFFARWHEDPRVCIPGGESFADVCDRVRPGVEAIIRADNARRILVSGHATVNRAILAAVMALEPEAARRFRVLNASLSRLRLEERSGNITALVESWNQTGHLED